jgi:chitin-binding protein
MNSRHWHRAVLAAALGLPFLLSGLAAAPAQAHGTASFPASRSFHCRFNDSGGVLEACKAAKAFAGGDFVFGWNEVSLPNAAGKLAELIPDGQLCGAGLNRFRALNLTLPSWPKTDMPTGERVEMRYLASAPHDPSNFRIFVTKDGYDPGQPLRFSDLEFVARVEDAPLMGDTYRFEVTLPKRSAGSPGIVYIHWQRERPASDEAFYSCSDATFR